MEDGPFDSHLHVEFLMNGALYVRYVATFFQDLYICYYLEVAQYTV